MKRIHRERYSVSFPVLSLKRKTWKHEIFNKIFEGNYYNRNKFQVSMLHRIKMFSVVLLTSWIQLIVSRQLPWALIA